MDSVWVDLGPTWTLMLFAKFGAEPQTNSDSDGLVVKAKATG